VQPLKDFPTFYGTRRFISTFTRAHHLFLSQARPIHSKPPYVISPTSILILSTHEKLSSLMMTPTTGHNPVAIPLSHMHTNYFPYTHFNVVLPASGRFWKWFSKPKYSQKIWPVITFSTTNPTWTYLESNPRCHDMLLEIDRLSYGMTITCACSACSSITLIGEYYFWSRQQKSSFGLHHPGSTSCTHILVYIYIYIYL
jgi:hypothetical protein